MRNLKKIAGLVPVACLAVMILFAAGCKEDSTVTKVQVSFQMINSTNGYDVYATLIESDKVVINESTGMPEYEEEDVLGMTTFSIIIGGTGQGTFEVPGGGAVAMVDESKTYWVMFFIDSDGDFEYETLSGITSGDGMGVLEDQMLSGDTVLTADASADSVTYVP